MPRSTEYFVATFHDPCSSLRPAEDRFLTEAEMLRVLTSEGFAPDGDGYWTRAADGIEVSVEIEIEEEEYDRNEDYHDPDEYFTDFYLGRCY